MTLRPSAVADYSIDGREVDAVQSGGFALVERAICIGAAQFGDGISGQFGMAVLGSTRRVRAEASIRRGAVASLALTVSIVLSKRAKEQVGRIATARVVARVADAQAIRYRSMRQFICNAMGSKLHVAAILAAASHAIAGVMDGCRPVPALRLVAACDFRPEPVLKRDTHPLILSREVACS
jgi:hypothetical protein